MTISMNAQTGSMRSAAQLVDTELQPLEAEQRYRVEAYRLIAALLR